MKKPNALIFSGYGLNCEEETAHAFRIAGARVQIVHINDIIDGIVTLHHFQILAFPGGFAYGDDTGSGNAYGSKVRNHLWEELMKFIQKDTLAIGICNGFQILVALGLLPALNKKYGDRHVALLPNSTARYTVRWTDVRVESDTPWLTGIETLSLPIAHGEGRLYADRVMLGKLEQRKLIALRYVQGPISSECTLPSNPTGTRNDIAGLTDETGRIIGIMPHPERAIYFTNLPHWTLDKECLQRAGKKIPLYGPGLAIFQNAVRYFA